MHKVKWKTRHFFSYLLQSEEARIAREVEAHEKRIRKELEKQDLLRRKVLLSEFMFSIFMFSFSIWLCVYGGKGGWDVDLLVVQ